MIEGQAITGGVTIPADHGLYYGGAWQAPRRGTRLDSYNPSTGEKLATIASGAADDVADAVAAARAGFEVWRKVPPAKRAATLYEMARIIRDHADELAMLDAMDCGNPIANLRDDLAAAARRLDYFAGLITEMKGSSVPVGPDGLSFSVRQPYGVVARVLPYNHPALFCLGKAASPLAAGNAVILKPPEQAPLSAVRIAELFDGLLPPGVFNVLTGGRDVGEALVSHPDVRVVGLVGSVATGRAIMRAAADTLKRLSFELGGKNALIAMPDVEPAKAAAAIVSGMNFTWCGQSCGSTSRAFVHADIYDDVVALLPALTATYMPGIATDPTTTMGSLIDRTALARVQSYVASAIQDGARLVCGGRQPADEALRHGCFFEPTIFADATMDMRFAREEIFGPVLAVIRWSERDEMLRQVNQVEYGLTCAVWSNDVIAAHRLVADVEAGFCWINEVSRHVLGSPFGGFKQSGIGREECLEELLSFTQEKNIYVNLKG